jgi:hypothetical protein
MPDNDRFDEMRQEIIQLLHAQLEALANLSGLTDAQLVACYKRQERVRELRDRLSVSGDWKEEDVSLAAQAATSIADNPAAAVSGI